MTFGQIQPSIAALIVADTALAALGTPIQVDPFQDPDAAKSAIAASLRTNGVAIEVGFPWIGAPETDLGGSTHVEGMCELFIGEHIKTAHSPSGIPLLLRVFAACTKRAVGTLKPFRVRSCETLKTESGYLMHQVTLFIPLNLPAS